MNDAPSRDKREYESAASASSAWMGWTLALLAAPVLYVLTLPPIALTAFTFAGTPGTADPPTWLQIYGVPYVWAIQYTPFRDPLTSYGAWWASLFGVSR